MSNSNQMVEPQKIVKGLKNLGCRKKRNCTIYVAKTKALIRCGVTAQRNLRGLTCVVTPQLIGLFDFAYYFFMTRLNYLLTV